MIEIQNFPPSPSPSSVSHNPLSFHLFVYYVVKGFIFFPVIIMFLFFFIVCVCVCVFVCVCVSVCVCVCERMNKHANNNVCVWFQFQCFFSLSLYLHPTLSMVYSFFLWCFIYFVVYHFISHNSLDESSSAKSNIYTRIKINN